jgi:hypothetical protein
MPLPIDHAGNRTNCVRVCIRDGWNLGGIAGQHKFFAWNDGTFTGMGSTTSEPQPDVEHGPASVQNLTWSQIEHEEYWVTPALETEMKQCAEKKKSRADSAIWVPVSNDCHTLVDDVLRECDLPPSGLGRFSGNSSTIVSRALTAAKEKAMNSCSVM